MLRYCIVVLVELNLVRYYQLLVICVSIIIEEFVSIIFWKLVGEGTDPRRGTLMQPHKFSQGGNVRVNK